MSETQVEISPSPALDGPPLGWHQRVFNKRWFIAAVSLFLLAVAVYSWQQFQDARALVYRDLDERLSRAAKSAWFIIGDSFHERALSHPLTPEDDLANIKTLTKLANDLEVKYLYALILDRQNSVRFTASSATAEELRTGVKLTRFMDAYENKPSIMKAFSTGQPVIDPGNRDQWGTFRSLFLPYSIPAGQTYLLAADIEVGKIEQLTRDTALKAFWNILYLFLGGVPLLILYQRELTRNNSELRRINSHLGEVIQEKTHQLIAHLSLDALTHLPNRHGLNEVLAKRDFTALVLLNIDDFKEVNDFFGIATADEVLKQTAVWLRELALDPYRVNGDEFAFLIRKPVTHDEIQHRLQTILALLSEKVFVIDGNPITIAMTAGVSIGPDRALTRADIALHRAKQTKKSFAFYDETENIEEQYKVNMAVTALVKTALTDNRILCHYQPIVRCETGEIEKYEALVRIVDENGRVIPPLDFLPIARRTKLYPYITREMVSQACTLFAARKEAVSINLSARDILDPITVTSIVQTLKRTGVGERVVFEILESEGIENFDQMSAFIKQVKALGACIAIDDFGTGYSNFENILKLEIDFIKIDGSLIGEIDTNPRHRIVVETIVAFAHHTGANTIAEFVSSEAIYQTVRQLGIGFAQGFHIGRPAPL